MSARTADASLELAATGVYPPGISHRHASGAMTRTKLFRSNRSQAVRLPKDVAFPEGVTEVTVLRDGRRRVIVPVNAIWDDFFDAPGIDLPPREQPLAQSRDPL